MRLDKAINFDDLRRMAKRRLPKVAFDFIEGGPFGEVDVREGRPVAVINAATRMKFFGSASALGQTLAAGRGTWPRRRKKTE